MWRVAVAVLVAVTVVGHPAMAAAGAPTADAPDRSPDPVPEPSTTANGASGSLAVERAHDPSAATGPRGSLAVTALGSSSAPPGSGPTPATVASGSSAGTAAAGPSAVNVALESPNVDTPASGVRARPSPPEQLRPTHLDRGPEPTRVVEIGDPQHPALTALREGPPVSDNAGVDAGRGANGTVRVDHRLNLTPERPGEVRVRLRMSLPADVERLSVAPSHRAAVVDEEGFVAEGGWYRWAGENREPTLTYRLAVNRTTDDGGKTAADVGDWALLRTPRPTVATAGDVDVNRTYDVEGDGVVGRSLVWLGRHDEHDRAVDGQRLRLVVPEAAELRSSPSAIASALANASRSLRVGDRDRSVVVVAAPTSVDWAYAGQQVGDSDAWVRADQSLYDPRNAWLHEYVHTRQAFRTTAGTRWLIEGTASYYAALLSLRQGLIDYEAFRHHLLAGTAGATSEATLSRPSTWTDNQAEYEKGRLVVGELDRRIRSASSQRQRFHSVLSQLNRHQGPVDEETFVALVARAGTPRTGGAAQRYTDRKAVPDPWSAETHRAAFGWAPPQVSERVSTVRAVDSGGPRDLAGADEVLIATNEQLRIGVSVFNTGGLPARAVTELRVDFSTVDRTVTRIPPSDSRSATVTHRFRRPGTYHVTVGGSALRVRVVEPASSARVADVSVDDDEAAPGETVRVTAWVSNRNDRPAQVTVPLVVDGSVVRRQTITLSPYEIRRVSAGVRFEGTGTHHIALGDRTVEVAVTSDQRGPVSQREPQPTARAAIQTPRLTIPNASPASGRSPLATPGSELLVTIAALAVAGLLVSRRP